MVSHQGILGFVMESGTVHYVGTHTKTGEVVLTEGSGKRKT